MSKRYLIIRGGYRKYDEISFLKGFSITAIVLMHLVQGWMKFLPGWIYKASLIGGSGVHIFFFCSGFGLYLSYRMKEIGYKDFLQKRFLNVYIPYVIAVLLYFLIPLVKTEGNRFVALLSHVFLFKMFFPQYEESFGPFWFISTIFQLYFIFIPLCKFKRRAGNKSFLLSAFGLSILWWLFTALTGINSERIWGSFFLQYIWEFCLGMVLADKLTDSDEIKINNLLLCSIAICGIGLEAFLGLQGGWLKAFNDIPALLGFGALGLLLFQIPGVRKIGVLLSNISYEWYLIHYLVFVCVGHFLGGWIACISAVIISILSAVLFCRVIKIVRVR